jgi:thioredoxin 1
MQTINEANFDDTINNGELVVIDFYAQWCRPCHALVPILERIEDQNPHVTFGKINIDENQFITDEYSVSAIPTIIMFKNGTPVKKFVGLPKEDVLIEAISDNG